MICYQLQIVNKMKTSKLCSSEYISKICKDDGAKLACYGSNFERGLAMTFANTTVVNSRESVAV